MNSDFGIPKVLKDLSRSEVENIVRYLKQELGVATDEDLKFVEEKHLTESKLLKPIPALKLMKHWREELLSAAEAPSGPSQGKAIQQDIKANTERVIAVAGGYNEKRNQAEIINQFEKVEDVHMDRSSGKNVYNVQGGIKGHGAFSKDYKTEVAEGATLNQNIS